jgi:hypothetical protein
VRRLLALAFDALLALILPIPPAQPVPPRRIPPRRPGMEPGSNVIVLDDPLAWGIGQVESVGVDGKVRVEFKHSIKGTLIESFNAFDLELSDLLGRLQLRQGRAMTPWTPQPIIWSDGTPVEIVWPLKQLYVNDRITLDELEDLTERALLGLPLVVYREEGASC